MFVYDKVKLKYSKNVQITMFKVQSLSFTKAFLVYASNCCPRKRMMIPLLGKVKLVQLAITLWENSEYLLHIVTWNPAHCIFSLVLLKLPMLFAQ